MNKRNDIYKIKIFLSALGLGVMHFPKNCYLYGKGILLYYLWEVSIRVRMTDFFIIEFLKACRREQFILWLASNF